jgi:hypothetical protein
MPAPVGTTPDDASYLRGVRVADVDTGRVVRVLVVVVLIGLMVLAGVLTVSATSQSSRLSKLRDHGVPVALTVTGCLAISSGIGMSVEYWDCRGSYTLGGHRYNEVIGGSRAHLGDGQVVEAIAVPGDPALVSLSTSVSQPRSSFTPYVTPIILAALSVTGALGLMVWSRRRRSHHPGSEVSPGGVPAVGS